MAEIPISLLLWGGVWLFVLLAALAMELRAGSTAAIPESAESEQDSIESPPAGAAVDTPLPEAPAKDPYARGLAKSQGAIAGRLRAILGSGEADDKRFEELEEVLIASDVGVGPAGHLVAAVRAGVPGQADVKSIEEALRREVRALLGEPLPEPEALPSQPWVQLVVGVNGVGKTTSIGKLAARHAAAGRRVLLVAGDTFRAAAADQLSVWAERTGAEIVRQDLGADPSSVAFDGMKAAQARQVDVVLVDTAGRLHTKVNLMEELRKVSRTLGRVVEGAPHEVLLVLDATTEQKALAQARAFAEIVPITGVVLTKLDGSARGGMTIAVRHELGAPVRYVGLGEGVSDLQVFDPDAFVAGLLPDDEPSET
jgi:fused signal recognition particle receptor